MPRIPWRMNRGTLLKACGPADRRRRDTRPLLGPSTGAKHRRYTADCGELSLAPLIDELGRRNICDEKPVCHCYQLTARFGG